MREWARMVVSEVRDVLLRLEEGVLVWFFGGGNWGEGGGGKGV